jgi:hypothetical protein
MPLAGASPDEDMIADVACSREPLEILDAVIASETAVCLALFFDERQCRMFFNGLP